MNLDSKTKSQLLKFIPVGIANTLVDWAILNLLLFFSRTEELLVYSFFKAISFSVAVLLSYFLNQHFVFTNTSITLPSESTEKYRRFGLFFIISFSAALINIFVATVATNFCYQQPIWNNSWFVFCGNLGAFLGTFTSAVWNFLGYKKIVFKENRL